ncbi:MAG: Rrf2 family transcriptional regulator [Dehalococcoidia bacterium]|nr:Rrf2 family transcriptional regulator [Dehalococcoidia bacterium]
MLYSKSAEYAIQAMLYLAENEGRGLVMVSSIAEIYNIPRHFLAKLVQTLTRNRLVKSYRGRNGGIKLARSSEKIVNAIEGPPPEQPTCVIGLDVCSDDAICPLHKQWQHIVDLMHDTLSSETLLDLAEGMRQKRRELAKALRESKLQETPVAS